MKNNISELINKFQVLSFLSGGADLCLGLNIVSPPVCQSYFTRELIKIYSQKITLAVV